LSEFGLVAPLGGLVVLAFLYLRRLSEGAAATAWGGAWLALYVAGTISTLHEPPRALVLAHPMLGSLFPALLLAGSLAFRSGSLSAWPVAAGIALGAARAALLVTGHPEVSLLAAATFELPMTLGAAAIAWRAAYERPRSFAEQMLGPTLVLLAVVNAADPLARLVDLPTPPLLIGWIAASLAVALLQVAAFVERGREQERRVLAERDLLYRVARLAAAEPRDARRALDGIVSEVAALASLDGFGVWLLDAAGRRLECVARLRRIDEMPDYLVALPADDPIVRRAFDSDEPVTVLDLRQENAVLRGRAQALSIGEAAVAPLRGDGRLLGAAFAGLAPSRRFDASDVRLLALLAQEIAIVLTRAAALEERARQSAALDAERRTLRAVVEAVPAGIVLIDGERRMTTLSRLGAALYGLGDPDAWVGRPSREAFAHYRDRLAPGEARRLLDQIASDPDEIEGFELRFALPEERVLDLTLRPVCDEDGERIGQLWVTRDVTEERRIGDRLQRVQRMEVLGTLAGGVAHDFNNQLTAILGNARVLLESAIGSDDERAALRDLEQAAEHCAELTRGLLAFARPTPNAPASVDVEKALREVEGLVRATFPPDVRLELRVAPKLQPAQADPAQLRRVLVNLAMNARDAVGARGTVTIAARNAAPDAAPALEIEVTDTGCGMDARTLEHLFDPFFTTKPPGQGTGLGLAIVYGILEAHGASVAVTSEPGAGATFRLRWPAARDAGLAGSAGSARAAVAPDAVPGGRETVLLAEDEPAVRRLARLALERRGYRVLEAADGEAALALFERHREDVAIAVLDLSMPGCNGLAALRAMRALVPGLPALVVTGRVEPQLEEPNRPPGVTVLPKPFRPDELAARLRAALDARRG
jgi:PAS domain S-box-containing protein